MEPAGSAARRKIEGSYKRRGRVRSGTWVTSALFVLIACLTAFSQQEFEDLPIADVIVTFEGSDKNVGANETFRVIALDTLGGTYSSVRVRDAMEKLYDTKEIASIIVEVNRTSTGSVIVRFVVRRKPQAQRVTVELPEDDDSNITEQDLLFRLNLLDPRNGGHRANASDQRQSDPRISS